MKLNVVQVCILNDLDDCIRILVEGATGFPTNNIPDERKKLQQILEWSNFRIQVTKYLPVYILLNEL